MQSELPLCRIVVMLALGLNLFFVASVQAAPNACTQITRACRSAGFVPGGERTGDGLKSDCFDPIVQGTPQPEGASRPLPEVEARWLAACRAANPNSGLSSQAPASGTSYDSQTPVSTNAAVPSGLVAVLPDKGDQPLDLSVMSNPAISGVALQIHWSDIEPSRGIPDWSKLDALFASAAAYDKWVQLLIFPGFFTPTWALSDAAGTNAKSASFPLQYGPGKKQGEAGTLPMPWDSVYLGNWSAFLQLLSQRYATNPAFRIIAAAGPTSVSVEATMPNSPADQKEWKENQYTETKYVGAWQIVLRAYAADFPSQYVSLSQGGPAVVGINAKGDIVGGRTLDTRQQIVDVALKILGRRFVLQNSNLTGNANGDEPNTDFVIGYIGRAVTGFQLRTSASASVMGSGDGPANLKAAIDNGMRMNADGNHVDYIEIYEKDVAPEDMQSSLRHGASLFGSTPEPTPIK